MAENREKKHYWCDTCAIPLINKVCNACGYEGVEIPSDLKPVFKKEYEYYLEYVNEKRYFPKILYRNHNRLISDITKGKTHYRIHSKKNSSADGEKLYKPGEFGIKLKRIGPLKRSRLRRFFLDDPRYLQKLFEGNEPYLMEIENEAIAFIRKMAQKFPKHHKIVSFSGGKDSTVTAYLVNKALGDLPILFSDTGIEYPETKNYVKKYGNKFGTLHYLDEEVNFLEMCKKLGPPSRTMRWCCFTNKGAPFSKFYSTTEHKRVLSFDGIRKDESNLRSNYPRHMDNTKYEKQYSAYPILNWTTLEVWLYILWKGLPYNDLYNHGFSRIGCWACPNNTKFDWFLFSKVYPDLLNRWVRLVHKYMLQQTETKKKSEEFGKGLDAYEFDWIEEGDWKSRRVKYHNEPNLLRIESPCGKHDFDLYLQNEVGPRLLEFLKVFGNVSKTTLPNGKTMHRLIHDRLVISFLEGTNMIKFYIHNENDSEKLKKRIVRQINKYFNCVDCGACVGSCPQGAISINPHFSIDEKKCSNCLICTGTKYIDMSCIALHYKQNRTLIKMKDIST